MAGPNVKWSFYNKFEKRKKQNLDKASPINLISFSLHEVHNAQHERARKGQRSLDGRYLMF